MPQQYELKQVRVYLKEAMPLYSNEEISSPESAIRIMSDALAGMDREYCCVVISSVRLDDADFVRLFGVESGPNTLTVRLSGSVPSRLMRPH